jgi:hypothetical protein
MNRTHQTEKTGEEQYECGGVHRPRSVRAVYAVSFLFLSSQCTQCKYEPCASGPDSNNDLYFYFIFIFTIVYYY